MSFPRSLLISVVLVLCFISLGETKASKAQWCKKREDELKNKCKGELVCSKNNSNLECWRISRTLKDRCTGWTCDRDCDRGQIDYQYPNIIPCDVYSAKTKNEVTCNELAAQFLGYMSCHGPATAGCGCPDDKPVMLHGKCSKWESCPKYETCKKDPQLGSPACEETTTTCESEIPGEQPLKLGQMACTHKSGINEIACICGNNGTLHTGCEVEQCSCTERFPIGNPLFKECPGLRLWDRCPYIKDGVLAFAETLDKFDRDGPLPGEENAGNECSCEMTNRAVTRCTHVKGITI